MPFPLSFIEFTQNFLDYFDEKSLTQLLFYSKENSNDVILNDNTEFEKILKDIKIIYIQEKHNYSKIKENNNNNNENNNNENNGINLSNFIEYF